MKRNVAIAIWLTLPTGCYVGTVGALSGADVANVDSSVIDVIGEPPVSDANDVIDVAAEASDDVPDVSDSSPDTIGDACVAPRVTCGSGCFDLTNDPLNCGACGVFCPAGQACVAGACVLHCALDTDCASGEVCVAGVCEPGMTDAGIDALDSGTCATGQALCGSTCADLSSDPTNCGACGVSCIAGHSCSAGVCI